MKNILIILLLLCKLSYSQLPYTWVTGVNPGWTSTNIGSGSSLNWQSTCTVVTTNW